MLQARMGPPAWAPAGGRGLAPLAWFCLACSLVIAGSQAINRHQHEGEDSALGRSGLPPSHKERARRQAEASVTIGRWSNERTEAPTTKEPDGSTETTSDFEWEINNEADLSRAPKALPGAKAPPEAPVRSSNETSEEFQARLKSWKGQVTDELSSQERAANSANKKSNKLRPRILPKRVKARRGFYPSSGVAKFLDLHPTKRILDPRVYLINYYPEYALKKISGLLEKQIPTRYVFAYALRASYEYGQRFASRLRGFEFSITSLLEKRFTTINSSPDADDFNYRTLQAFHFTGENKGRKFNDSTITSLISKDKVGRANFEQALNVVGIATAEHLAGLRQAVRRATKGGADSYTRELGDAFTEGVYAMHEKVSWLLKWDVTGFMNQITKTVVETLKKNQKLEPPWDIKTEEPSDSVPPSPQILSPQRRRQYQQYLFDDLDTTERVVRVFAQLMTIFQGASIEDKDWFIKNYWGVVTKSLEETMPSFIWLQSKAPKDVDSHTELALESVSGTKADNATARPSEPQDLSKLAARCYLAGRRWRLLLEKSMRKYKKKDDIIHGLVELVSVLKDRANKKTGAGQRIEKTCLPKLELGVRGWSIEGASESESKPLDNQFPLKPPIEELNKEEDPFAAGVRFGSQMGFMIGYNDKLNQTHDMGEDYESAPHRIMVHPDNTLPPKEKQKAYITRVSYRRGLVAAAREVIEHGAREGYMAALKVTMRAGMLLPLEAGSKLASLQGANLGTIAGRQAGHAFLNKYLAESNIYSQERSQLESIAGAEGARAGQWMGDVLGAIAGHESALEAYRRTITRGGKLTDAKFHLDEYIAGAKTGFEYGMVKGKEAGMAEPPDIATLDFFRLKKPKFSSKVATAFGLPKPAGTTSKPAEGLRSGLIELPADLPTTSTKVELHTDYERGRSIDPLPDKALAEMHAARNHTRVKGTLTGSYKVAKEIKKGMQRISLSNLTYSLEVRATGFIMDGTAYLTLKGSINNAPVLHGSLLTRDLHIPE